MKKKAFAAVILVVLIAAMASCGTSSSLKRGRIGCPSTRYSIGY